MEVNENVLIKLLKDSNNIDLIINQLAAFKDKVSGLLRIMFLSLVCFHQFYLMIMMGTYFIYRL